MTAPMTSATRAGAMSTLRNWIACSSCQRRLSVSLRSTAGSCPLASPARIRLTIIGSNASRWRAIASERLAPAWDRLDQVGDHLAQAEALDRVAKVGERLGDGHARGEELFEVEAEVDELAAAYRRTQRPGSRRGRRRTRDEVEVEPAKAGLEVELVRPLPSGRADAAPLVHRPVPHRDEGHYAPPRAGAGAEAAAESSGPAPPRGPPAPPPGRRPGRDRRPARSPPA